jgi:hypothetical protein
MTPWLLLAPIAGVLLAAFVVLRGLRSRQGDQRVSTQWLDENVRERRQD